MFATDSGSIYTSEDWTHLHGCPLLHLCQEAAQVKSLEPGDWRWLTDIAPPWCLLWASVLVERQSPSRMKWSTAASFFWWFIVAKRTDVTDTARQTSSHQGQVTRGKKWSQNQSKVLVEAEGHHANKANLQSHGKNVAHESSSQSFSKDSCMSCVRQLSSVCTILWKLCNISVPHVQENRVDEVQHWFGQCLDFTVYWKT